jgi:hypothetical protein
MTGRWPGFANDGGPPQRILLAIHDVTESQQLIELQASRPRYRKNGLRNARPCCAGGCRRWRRFPTAFRLDVVKTLAYSDQT